MSLEFENKLTPTSIVSDFFTVYDIRTTSKERQVWIEDNGNGILKTFYIENGVTKFFSNVGTVDYIKGIVKLSIKPLTSSLTVYATLNDEDVSASHERVLKIDTSKIQVTIT